MDTQRSDEAQNDSFKAIAPQKDNAVHKEFEIGKLVHEQLHEDELTRNEPGQGAPGNTKPSQLKF